MLRTLDRYVIRETIPPFLLSLLVFTFILEIPPIMRDLEQLVAKGVSWSAAGRILLTLIPQGLGLTIPMALLTGILIALGRLSGDREAVALLACGVSPYRLLRPVVLMSLLAAAGTLYVMVEAIGWFFLLPFVGRTVFPLRLREAGRWLRRRIAPPVGTTVTVDKLSKSEAQEMLAAEHRATIRRVLREQYDLDEALLTPDLVEPRLHGAARHSELARHLHQPHPRVLRHDADQPPVELVDKFVGIGLFAFGAVGVRRHAIVPAELLERISIQGSHFTVEVAGDHDNLCAIGARLDDFRACGPRRNHHDALQTRRCGVGGDGSGGIAGGHHRGGFDAELLRDRKSHTVAPVLERSGRQNGVVFKVEIDDADRLAQARHAQERRRAFAQGHDRGAPGHGQEIEPPPERTVSA